MSARTSAISVMGRYLRFGQAVFASVEDNCAYRFAIKEAMYAVNRTDEPPLSVLERLQLKYDAWAHESKHAHMYAVMAAAIDDMINILLTN